MFPFLVSLSRFRPLGPRFKPQDPDIRFPGVKIMGLDPASAQSEAWSTKTGLLKAPEPLIFTQRCTASQF